MPCTKIPRSGFVHSLSYRSLFLTVPLPDQRHSGPTGQFPMISFWNLSHCEETKSPKPLCLHWGMHVSVHVCALYLSLIPTLIWGLDRMSLWSMISYQLWKTDHWKWQGHGVCKIVNSSCCSRHLLWSAMDSVCLSFSRGQKNRHLNPVFEKVLQNLSNI